MLRSLSEASAFAGPWLAGGCRQGLRRWQDVLPCQHTAVASYTTSQPCKDDASTAPAEQHQLTDEQKQKLSQLLLLMNQPAGSTIKAAATVAKAVTMRDLYVVMDQLYQRDSWQNPYPLARDSKRAAQLSMLEQQGSSDSSGKEPQARGTRLSYPMLDVTKLPDLPDDNLNLKQEFMNSPLCWMQLLPNHLEVSYSLVTGIYLWPPQEVFYPDFFDFDLIWRHMQRKMKGSRAKPRPKHSRK